MNLVVNPSLAIAAMLYNAAAYFHFTGGIFLINCFKIFAF